MTSSHLPELPSIQPALGKQTSMYSSQPAAAASYSNSSFDELRWVIHIRRTLDEELEDDAGDPVCIFNVPKNLTATKPECYIPQQVAIGPYHYWQPELNEMERYKVASAKRTQKQFHNLKFHNLVDQLMKLEPRLRACYHKSLDFNGETLAWMMAVDGCFLLEFLHINAIKDSKILKTVLSSMLHVIGHAGRKAIHDAFLRDMVMLENQIPLFILRKILQVQHSSLDAADELLHYMLMNICKEISPFKKTKDCPIIEVSESAHLLDFAYHFIVPAAKPKQQCEIIIEEAPHQNTHQGDQTAPADHDREEKFKFGNSSDVKKLFKMIWKLIWELICKSNAGWVSFVKRALVSKPIRVAFRLPWSIISRIPILSLLKEPLEYLFFSDEKAHTESENNSSNSSNNSQKPILIEEINIPSVSELHKSGIRFVATEGDINTISFDARTFTFHLPSVSLDVNTEVILRNLVAYETSNASGPLVFTRYVDLMNGIIDTEEDVKLLREKGIVLNHLKSDQEVADLWNGMNKSVRLTKVPFLDNVIEDVNKYYSGRWKVKAKKFLKNYVFGSWQFLTLLAAILLLVLMSVQAFCSVYSCARVLGNLEFNTTTDG